MALSIAFIPIHSRADGSRASAAAAAGPQTQQAARWGREMARSDKETCSHLAHFFLPLRLAELNRVPTQPAVTECAECQCVVTHSYQQIRLAVTLTLKKHI